ncbi:MAG: hypothetical protein M3081_19085 [Gemmatimonadota bacterium]|nr:hypothetical protein [Gemmatimonadota bacterium]
MLTSPSDHVTLRDAVLIAALLTAAACRARTEDASSGAAAHGGAPSAPAAASAAQPIEPTIDSTFGSVALVEKESRTYAPVATPAGGPQGILRYRLRAAANGGTVLDWHIDATGLDPRRAYRIEAHADSGFYSVARVRSDTAGALHAGGTLDRFADHTCVGLVPSAPRAVAATRALGFAIKNDGAPEEGSGKTLSPTSAASASLPCSGNGDNSFEYRLFERTTIRLAP